MNQVNVICLPHAGYMVKTTITRPLSPMQIRKSTGCLFFNCLQFTQIGEKAYIFILHYKAVFVALHSTDFYIKL